MATRGKRRVTAAHDEEVAGTYSSPACYLHEFEAAEHAPKRGVGIKRIYDPPASADGFRVLIDRLWPRGLGKERAALDAWLVDLAPSAALRIWFHHDRER